MEKITFQRTEYDLLADKLGLIDKNNFLSNLKILANYDDRYKDIFNEILTKSEKYIEIEPDLSFKEWKDGLIKAYLLTINKIDGVYNLVCNKYNIKMQEYTDEKEMFQVCYDAYRKHYKEFIEMVHIIVTPEGYRKYMLPVKRKTDISNKTFEIPPVPYVPPAPN